MNSDREQAIFKLHFNDMLLASVILLIFTGVAMAVGFYVLPSEPLRVPAAEPTVRVSSVQSFPVGASRVTHWGERIIIVVRRDENRFTALEGVSPSDGCILEWDDVSSRLSSPCSHVVYDLRGNVITGLSRAPLRRYAAFVRDDVLYVTE